MARPLARFLNRLLVRSELSTSAQKALLAIDARLLEKGARWDIVRGGQRVHAACLVEEGLVGQSEQFADGTRRTAAYFIPGDMCNLHSLPVPVARWNITALTDCKYYEVPHDALWRAFDAHRDLAIALWRDTVADATILAKSVTVLSGSGARQRVAHVLCEFGMRSEAARLGSRTAFAFPLTQAQLAEMIGITPVHLSRVLQQLGRDRIVTQLRGGIEVIDLPALEQIAEFDPRYLMLDRVPQATNANP